MTNLDSILENSLAATVPIMKSNHVASDKSTCRVAIDRSRGQFSIVLPVSRSIMLFQSPTRAQSDECRSVRTSEGQCGIARQPASTRWTVHANSVVSSICPALSASRFSIRICLSILFGPIDPQCHNFN